MLEFLNYKYTYIDSWVPFYWSMSNVELADLFPKEGISLHGETESSQEFIMGSLSSPTILD